MPPRHNLLVKQVGGVGTKTLRPKWLGLALLSAAAGRFSLGSWGSSFGLCSWKRPWISRWRGKLRAVASSLQEPMPLDEETVRLHKSYHDRSVDYTVQNYDWVNAKSYSTDSTIAQEEHDDVWRVSKTRLQHWPQLEQQHIHEVGFNSKPQRFCDTADAEALGDPGDNIFIINLPRRPAKLKHVLAQLHAEGLNAKIVDAIDGDAFTSQEEIAKLGASTLPNYCGHKHTLPHLTTGQLGCFMSHFTIWHYMVEHSIPSALILEDDFDLQENFRERLGNYLEEARSHDWNLMYLGRSPTEPDISRISAHLAQPGYTLWTVGYIFKLDAARALVEANVETRLAPLDHYFSVAMGQGFSGHWNENAVEWSKYIPQVLRGLAITPPLVMPYVGSMFLSDTAMLRNGTKFVTDLPQREGDPWPAGRKHEAEWRAAQGVSEL